jgi:hypothetical protein
MTLGAREPTDELLRLSSGALNAASIFLIARVSIQRRREVRTCALVQAHDTADDPRAEDAHLWNESGIQLTRRGVFR